MSCLSTVNPVTFGLFWLRNIRPIETLLLAPHGFFRYCLKMILISFFFQFDYNNYELIVFGMIIEIIMLSCCCIFIYRDES